MTEVKKTKGNPAERFPGPGPGRPKGVPNKLTADVKAAILEAFQQAGGATYLARIADEKPETFCALLGKVLPMTISGGEGTSGKLVIKWES